VNKCLRTVALSWIFLLTLNHDARNHKSKKKLEYTIIKLSLGNKKGVLWEDDVRSFTYSSTFCDLVSVAKSFVGFS
jgi:hypothetical protein